jgi:hypothetical protein
MMLLRDCSRINQALLHCLLGESTSGRTYNARGNSMLEIERGMVSLRA